MFFYVCRLEKERYEIMSKTAKRSSKRASRTTAVHEKFHKILLTDDKLRRKLYEEFGRVRCYLYKTARSSPNENTAKIIQKITGLPATAWPR